MKIHLHGGSINHPLGGAAMSYVANYVSFRSAESVPKEDMSTDRKRSNRGESSSWDTRCLGPACSNKTSDQNVGHVLHAGWIPSKLGASKPHGLPAKRSQSGLPSPLTLPFVFKLFQDLQGISSSVIVLRYPSAVFLTPAISILGRPPPHVPPPNHRSARDQSQCRCCALLRSSTPWDRPAPSFNQKSSTSIWWPSRVTKGVARSNSARIVRLSH